MGGNREQGLKAAAKNRARDPDYYVKLGQRSAEAYKALPLEQRKPRGLAYVKLHDPKRFLEISARGGKASAGKASNG